MLPAAHSITAQPALGVNFGTHLAPSFVSIQVLPDKHNVGVQIGFGVDAKVRENRQADRMINLDNMLDNGMGELKNFRLKR